MTANQFEQGIATFPAEDLSYVVGDKHAINKHVYCCSKITDKPSLAALYDTHFQELGLGGVMKKYFSEA